MADPTPTPASTAASSTINFDTYFQAVSDRSKALSGQMESLKGKDGVDLTEFLELQFMMTQLTQMCSMTSEVIGKTDQSISSSLRKVGQ